MSLSRTITPFTPHLFLGLRQGPPADYSNQPLNPHRVFVKKVVTVLLLLLLESLFCGFFKVVIVVVVVVVFV